MIPNIEELQKYWVLAHDQVIALNVSKGKDYESGGVKFTDYYSCVRDVWLQVHRKALRLKSLLGDPKQTEKPNHETIRQNAIDLAGYALWLAAWLEVEEQSEQQTDP